MSMNTPGGQSPYQNDPSGAGQPGQPQQPYQQPGQPYQQPGAMPPAAPGQAYGENPYPKNQLGVWSLVLGILGIVGSCFYGFGLLPGIAAVVTGHLGKKAVREGQADNGGLSTGGLITGYVGVALSLIVGILMIAGVGMLMNNPEMLNELEQQSTY